MAKKTSQADYLKRCQQRVIAAKAWRKDEGYDDLWRRMIKLYAGKQFPKSMSKEDRIAVNIAFSTINVIAPSVSVNHPAISVSARKPEMDDSAVVTQVLLNYWWKHYGVTPEFRLAVNDFLMVGHGWMKCGYRFVEEQVDRDPSEYAADIQGAQAEAEAYALENPHMAGQLPSPEEIAASIPDTEARVTEDRPFAERVSVFDMLIDPDATHLANARWIAQRVIKDIDEVRSDDRYDAGARRKVSPDMVVEENALGDRKKNDPDCQRVAVWEYYDLRNGTMCVFTETCESFLVKPTAQPYAFGHPFVMLRNYEVPDMLYPMGELEAIEDLQGELNKTRSAQMNDRKAYKRKYLVDMRGLAPNAIQALESEKDNVFVPVNGDNVDIDKVIFPLPAQQLNPQMYAASEQIIADANMVVGVSEYQRGQTPDIRRTATEIAATSDAANSRAALKMTLIEEAIGSIAKRLVMLAQQYMTEPAVARITSSATGEPVWTPPIEPDWIQGEFDYEVEGGSTAPVNENQKRDKAMGMLQALSPFMGPAGSGAPLDAGAILALVLRDAFQIKDPAKYMGQMPMQQAPGDAPPLPPEMLGGQGTPPSAAPAGPQGAPPQGPPQAGPGGIPPELLQQLAGQVGMPAPVG